MAQKLSAARQRALKREAVGWEELSDDDFARLFEEGQPVKVRIRRPPPKTLTIALDERILNDLKRVELDINKSIRDTWLPCGSLNVFTESGLPKIIVRSSLSG